MKISARNLIPGRIVEVRKGMTTAHVRLDIGGAVVTNMAWPLVLLPLVLAALVAFVIRREEAYLLTEFGDAYDAYRREVRRWL